MSLTDGNSGGQQALAAGIVQLMERQQAEKENLSAQELVIDGSNRISFPGYPYVFEALGEKIIVSIDVFKSGYECKVCMGRKKLDSKCECETKEGGRPGYRYTLDEIDAIRKELGESIALARTDLKCSECQGDYPSKRTSTTCTACRGVGATLIMPDESKNLPTTGVVVSMGSQCDRKKLGFKVGARILFGPYSGNMIPTKAGILFKIMDASAAWATIDGADEMGQFDFILQDALAS
jgi:co-chaperonin GroES (HSP10)